MSDSEDVIVSGKKSRISVLKSEDCAHNDISGDEIVCPTYCVVELFLIVWDNKAFCDYVYHVYFGFEV